MNKTSASVGFLEFIKFKHVSHTLELLEAFLGAGGFGHLQHVETDRLGNWSVLANSHNVSGFHVPARLKKNTN